MKCLQLLLISIFFNISTVHAGTVFSWVDANGVMHFTDKKPAETEVKSDKLITKIVEVTNILESQTTPAESESSINNNRSDKTNPENISDFKADDTQPTLTSNSKV